MLCFCIFFFFLCYGDPRDLHVRTHSFPTRRSSDLLFATLSLSWRMAWARWASAVVAAGIMAVPFLFWTTNPAAFLSDTLVGAFAFGLAVGTRPEPGTSAVAAMTGPDTPPGWSSNPSDWKQRLPIIFLATDGLAVQRSLYS